jgi:hypothetical protein
MTIIPASHEAKIVGSISQASQAKISETLPQNQAGHGIACLSSQLLGKWTEKESALRPAKLKV